MRQDSAGAAGYYQLQLVGRSWNSLRAALSVALTLTGLGTVDRTRHTILVRHEGQVVGKVDAGQGPDGPQMLEHMQARLAEMTVEEFAATYLS